MRQPRPALDAFVAGYALGGIVIHDATHLAAGRWYDVFWVCNLAALLIGPAILMRSGALAQVALTWLLPGTLVWLTDVMVAGSNILPTSYNVHFGGTLAALYGVRRCGRARLGFPAAVAFLIGVWLFSRWVLPELPNVNAAHHIPAGWSFLGDTPLAFRVASAALALGVCGFGQLLAWLLTRTRASAAGA